MNLGWIGQGTRGPSGGRKEWWITWLMKLKIDKNIIQLKNFIKKSLKRSV